MSVAAAGVGYEPQPTNKIYDSMTFSSRASYPSPQCNQHRRNTSLMQNVPDLAPGEIKQDSYLCNEIYIFRAIGDYITADGKSITDNELDYIINSFQNAPVGSFLRELYTICKVLRENNNGGYVGVLAYFNSIRDVLLKLCEAAQQDNMHDFYDTGRSIVTNFKKTAKKYIDPRGAHPLKDLKYNDFLMLGDLTELGVFKEAHHNGGKYAIDTISEEHKKHFASFYVPPTGVNRPTFLMENSKYKTISKVTVLQSSGLDGTGTTIKTTRDTEFDCIDLLGNPKTYYPSGGPGSIELAIYSIGAIAYASMFDLVCYDTNSTLDWRYMFYTFFKYHENEDKEVVNKTKTIVMVLVRLGFLRGSRETEEISVNNRDFTVDNVAKAINKVYNTIDKITNTPALHQSNWFDLLRTDKLFMGILKLCVPSNIRNSIRRVLDGEHGAHAPIWDHVEPYISNAKHLYTKIRISGKGLGDFNQSFTVLVLNNLADWQQGKFVFNTNTNNYSIPSEPTTPLALITIDRYLAYICKIIGTYFLLSSPGFFFTDPDAIYRSYDTLQKYHNFMNLVPIWVKKNPDVATDMDKKEISEADSKPQYVSTINLGDWVQNPPHAADQYTVVLSEHVDSKPRNRGRTYGYDANLTLTVNYTQRAAAAPGGGVKRGGAFRRLLQAVTGNLTLFINDVSNPSYPYPTPSPC